MKSHVSQKQNDGLMPEGTQKPVSNNVLPELTFRIDQDKRSCLLAVIERAEQQRSKFEQSEIGRFYLSRIASWKRNLQYISGIQNP